jgi:putative intracellular protease/amidase
MFKILLGLHLLFAVFTIGPLVQAATTAGRGVRTGDAAAMTSSARVLRIYAYASLLVVIVGFGLASATSPSTHKKVAQFGDTWIWLSLVLWAVAVGLVLAVVVPGLQAATAAIRQDKPATNYTARIAAAGGVVAVLFAVVIFLMVYRPGN